MRLKEYTKIFRQDNGLFANGKASHSELGISVESEKGKPLISVIVPVLQEEKVLEQNLKLFSNELKKKYNFELIVSDGGSTDKTPEIAKKFADKYVEHEEDYRQTIAEGRNKGAEAAEGDLFVFINGDTYPADIENFLNLIHKFAASGKANENCAALACYVSYIPEEGKLRDKIFYTLHNNYVRFLNAIGMGMGRGECQIIRKDIFEMTGGYNEEIVAGEDFDLFNRVTKYGRVRFVPELKVLESPRRFRKYGYTRTVGLWLLNSLSVYFFGKSISKEWEAVR